MSAPGRAAIQDPPQPHPAAPPPWDYAGFSSKGPVRFENQDHWLAEPALGLFMVADGIASRQGGARAATLALESIALAMRHWTRRLESPKDLGAVEAARLLKAALGHAHGMLLEASAQQDPAKAMGTTVVLAMLLRHEALLVHLGDSRAYALSEGRLLQLTRDHTVATMLADPGLSPELRQSLLDKEPGAIVRSLGCGLQRRSAPGFVRLDLKGVDLLVLATDGLYRPLGPLGLAGSLAASNGLSLLARAEALVSDSERLSGRDNATVLLVKPGPGGAVIAADQEVELAANSTQRLRRG